jgi:sugar transferase (PEP-CTERM/EpsH1 system associated)
LRVISGDAMRDLLFLCHRIPYPPNKGDKIRAWHFLEHFAKSRRVHLGCFVDDEHDWVHVPSLRGLGSDTCILPLRRAGALTRSASALLTRQSLTAPYYRHQGMASWVTRMRQERPITAFVYSSSMAQYVMDDASAPRVIDFVDVDSQKWVEYSRRKRWPMSAIYRREGEALLDTEREIAREFDASIFVTDAEAALFRQLAPAASDRVFTISNGVDSSYFSPEGSYPNPYGGDQSALCFTGMMDYWPNIDAVVWFVHSILPRIRAVRPTATFWIVGANPAPPVRVLAREPGVVVTGRVPDTRPYLAHAAAIVAPLRIARGIQNKVLEAMAMGRPTVISTQAFEGLRAEPDRDLLVARNADEFVSAIVRIWSEGLAHTLGARARHAVQTLYDWPRQLASLEAVLSEVEADARRGRRFSTARFSAVS